MTQSLITGASGLLSHQRKLDVVANNLANLNTVGYKSQQILFSDVLYNTFSPAAAASANSSVGGINPRQSGFGVQVAQTSRNNGQGVLNATGGAFDFAIQGDGYFVLSDGNINYTRAGAFALDGRGFLVDPSSGAYVQRNSDVGDKREGEIGFQVPGDKRIKVPLGEAIGGKATSNVTFLGNLPAVSTPPQAHEMTSNIPFRAGGSAATATTLLNNLDTNAGPYTTGDQIELKGVNFDGSPITRSLAVDATTTLGDLVNFYNSALTGATAELQSDGKILVTAATPGTTSLQLELSDAVSNSGGTELSNHGFLTKVLGKPADKVETTMQVFDIRGGTHSLSVEFEKSELNVWNANFQLIDGTGTAIDSQVQRLEFAEDGTFLAVRGTGAGDKNIELRFNTLSEDQTIDISLENLSHLATTYTSSYEQDGFPPGTLATVNVSLEGRLEAVATNGRRVPIAQLEIANFINPQGLEAVGQNYFRATGNSGDPQYGASLSGANAFVRGGQLESSNVDVALEFTQLIVAQRGFSANARTITVASEVLQELTNIVR